MIYRNVDIRSQARWSSRKSWLPSVDPAFSFHLQAPSINKSPYADRKPMKGLLTASIGPSVGWWVLVLKGARYWPFIVSPIPSSWHREFSLVLSILQQTKFPWTSRSTNIEVHSAGKIEWWLIKEDVVVDVLCLVVLNTILWWGHLYFGMVESWDGVDGASCREKKVDFACGNNGKRLYERVWCLWCLFLYYSEFFL